MGPYLGLDGLSIPPRRFQDVPFGVGGLGHLYFLADIHLEESVFSPRDEDGDQGGAGLARDAGGPRLGPGGFPEKRNEDPVPACVLVAQDPYHVVLLERR